MKVLFKEYATKCTHNIVVLVGEVASLPSNRELRGSCCHSGLKSTPNPHLAFDM